jgi:uncharacterized protein (TIGR03437 family)
MFPRSLLALALLATSATAQLFQPAGSLLFQRTPFYALADFNLDGRLDFVSAYAPSYGVLVSLGTPSGGFGPAPGTPLLIGFAPFEFVPGDFNDDGKMDVAAVGYGVYPNGRVRVILGAGDGTFSLGGPQLDFSGFRNSSPAADFDQDGNLDLAMVTANSDGGLVLSVVRGDGKGGLVQGRSVNLPTRAERYAYIGDTEAADMNGDNRTDLVFTVNLATQGFGLIVALTDGQGSFTASSIIGTQQPSLGGRPRLAVGDFNGDRRLDVVMFDYLFNTVTLFTNSGNGVLTPQISTSVNMSAVREGRVSDLVAADFDLDGHLDWAASMWGATEPGLFLAFGNGNGTFALSTASQLPYGSPLAAVDLTGDRRPDLTAMAGDTLTLLRNTSQRPPLIRAQQIQFPQLQDSIVTNGPLTLSAAATSGLRVTFGSLSNSVCSVSKGIMTFVSTGVCRVFATQAGNSEFALAATVAQTFTIIPVPTAPRILSIRNAASYASGSLAPSSYGVTFGERLGMNPVVKLRDASTAEHPLELIFAGATQINFIVPPNAARGEGTIIVSTSAGSAEFPVTIAATAPGLFSANGTGQGLAAAQALIVNNDKSITTLTVGDGPIPIRTGTEIYLVLYGTGIRGHGADVSALVAGRNVEVLYAGPQGAFPGLDQVNLRVPLSVGGSGSVEIRLTVDGLAANAVTAVFQ